MRGRALHHPNAADNTALTHMSAITSAEPNPLDSELVIANTSVARRPRRAVCLRSGPGLLWGLRFPAG